MARMTDEEKRQRKIDRKAQHFKQLRIHKCINQTAALFQRLVRLKAIDSHGRLTCCSCGKRDYPGNQFDAGHWIGRSSKAVIFDDRNCHPQCKACNRFETGPVKANYDEFMRTTYGQDVMDELKRKSNKSKQWTREELAELHVSFREELRRLEDNQ